MGLSLPHLAIFLAVALVWGIPSALILRKAGFSPAWAVVCLIPPLSVVLFWVVALMPWPKGRAD